MLVLVSSTERPRQSLSQLPKTSAAKMRRSHSKASLGSCPMVTTSNQRTTSESGGRPMLPLQARPIHFHSVRMNHVERGDGPDRRLQHSRAVNQERFVDLSSCMYESIRCGLFGE